MIPPVIISMLVAGLVAFVLYKEQEASAIRQARQTARAVARQVSAERFVYTNEVIGKLRKDGIVPNTVRPKAIDQYGSEPGAIPLPATFVHLTSATVNTGGGPYTLDLISRWNLNPNKKPDNPWKADALMYLEQHPDQLREQLTGEGESTRYFAVTADVASVEACVTCHNEHPKSEKRDFKIGDVMGGLVVSVPMSKEIAAAKASAFRVALIILGAFLGVLVVQFLLQWLIIGKPLLRALNELERAADRISMGEVDVPIKSLGDDEIGRLGGAFERMRVSLASAMQQLEKQE
jgi:HAMP domain-containing protein